MWEKDTGLAQWWRLSLSATLTLTSWDLRYTLTFEASALVQLLLRGCLHWMAGAVQRVRLDGLPDFRVLLLAL